MSDAYQDAVDKITLDLVNDYFREFHRAVIGGPPPRDLTLEELNAFITEDERRMGEQG